MEQSFDFSSYNNIKRLSENELEVLWEKYLSDKSDKHSRDLLIVQYIYLVRYAVGRVKSISSGNYINRRYHRIRG